VLTTLGSSPVKSITVGAGGVGVVTGGVGAVGCPDVTGGDTVVGTLPAGGVGGKSLSNKGCPID